MARQFESLEDAFTILSELGNPDWGAAFSFLASHPDTSNVMLETFRETLAEMGVEPSGNDPDTGEPVYTLDDVAKTLGVPTSELDAGSPD